MNKVIIEVDGTSFTFQMNYKDLVMLSHEIRYFIIGKKKLHENYAEALNMMEFFGELKK